mgnify:CR=1 FL=1
MTKTNKDYLEKYAEKWDNEIVLKQKKTNQNSPKKRNLKSTKSKSGAVAAVELESPLEKQHLAQETERFTSPDPVEFGHQHEVQEESK